MLISFSFISRWVKSAGIFCRTGYRLLGREHIVLLPLSACFEQHPKCEPNLSQIAVLELFQTYPNLFRNLSYHFPFKKGGRGQESNLLRDNVGRHY